MKIERLKADLAKAKEKAAQWQVRVKDIERLITEQENLAIIQAVRDVTATPEELRDLLDCIRSAKELPKKIESKEKTNQYEE